MGINLNSVTLAGNLTRDPELKSLPSGAKVVAFSIATNERYTKKETGEKVEKTEYHNIVGFNKLAELVGQYLTKGQNVLVQGKIQTRSWEGEDGQKRYRTEILASSVQFGPKSSPGGEQAANTGAHEGHGASAATVYDGMPSKKAAAPAKRAPAKSQPSGIEYPTEEIDPADIPF
jgi:single-strand DNA-binding protein